MPIFQYYRKIISQPQAVATIAAIGTVVFGITLFAVALLYVVVFGFAAPAH